MSSTRTDPDAAPDPRFTLANERTFLAWIRTSLALLASGVAVDAFVTSVDAAVEGRPLPQQGFAPTVSAVLVLLGLVVLVAVGAP